jgi:ABC-2 type transport system ATP-binding protein
MIRIEGLTKSYGQGRGIFNLDLHVAKGTIFGYIGPNGSGKSTTIKLLCGLIRADSGHASVGGVRVEPGNTRAIKRLIGYLPDHFGVYDQMSVWEYLDFFCAAYRIPAGEREARVNDALALTNAGEMIDYQIASLSKGMHQRIGLARTLLHDPEVLILDEPASGLDPSARIEMRRTIQSLRELGKTILLSSHILPELSAVCDTVGILEKGHLLACGGVREITRKLREHLVLVITVAGESQKARELIAAFPNTENVTVSGDDVRLGFNGNRLEVADLNRNLVENGVRVLGIREEETDLEQVFLSVTGKASAAAVSNS